MLAVGVIVGVFLLLCGGAGTVAYFVAKSVAGPAGLVDLAERGESFDRDAADFNRSLASPPADPCATAELCQFVAASIAKARAGEPIPFSNPMFLEAIEASPQFGGNMGMIDRISIGQWLALYQPAPDDVDDYDRVLNSVLDDEGKTARVDLLFYSEDNQAEAQQWFLVREPSGWKVYDWQNLEHGRRMSDEYAAYAKDLSDAAEGYDLAIERASEAQSLFVQGEEDRAVAQLASCDEIPMSTYDRSVARLRCSYVWMANGMYEEALQRLQSIPNPDRMWGVWPVLALCHLNLDDLPAALAAAKKCQAQSPDNPRTHWLLSVVHDAMNDQDQAARYAALAMAGCPQDQTLVSAVIDHRRPEDIEPIIAALAQCPPDAWTRLADSVAYDRPWAERVVAAIEGRGELPPGAEALIRANSRWAEKDFDGAAKGFLIAQRQAQDESIISVAKQDHIDARIENDRYTELFNESDDLAETLETITRWNYDDDFYGDQSKLAQAVERLPDSEATGIWKAGLLGWSYQTLGRSDEALGQLERFERSLAGQADAPEGSMVTPDSISADAVALANPMGETDWLRQTARQRIVDVLLDLDRPVDAVQRSLSNDIAIFRIGNGLIQRGDPAAWREVLDATESPESPAVKVLRLRLESQLAIRRGDVRQADQRQSEAIAIANQIHPDEPYGPTYRLNQDRARALVIGRALPNEVLATELLPSELLPSELLIGEADPPGDTLPAPTADKTSADKTTADKTVDGKTDRNGQASQLADLIAAVVRQSAVVEDSDTLRAWFERGESMRLGRDTISGLRQAMAEFRFSQGDFQMAVQTLEADLVSDDAEDDESSDGESEYARVQQDVRRAELAAQACLEQGQAELAGDWLSATAGKDGAGETASASSEIVPPETLVAVAQGDVDTIRDRLASVDADQAGYWLGRDASRRWLERFADADWMPELLRDFPLSIRSHMTEASGALLLSADVAVDKAALAKRLSGGLGEDFSLVEVPTSGDEDDGDGDDGDDAYIASSPSGWRLLVGVGSVRYQRTGWPRGVADRLVDPVTRVTIDVLDQQPMAKRRLFETAAAMLADVPPTGAIAMLWMDEAVTWWGDDLRDRIEWVDRVPVDAETFTRLPVPVPDPENGDDEDGAASTVFLDGEAWQSKLDATPDLPVTVTLRCGFTEEAIACRLIAVDADSYQLTVRPTTASKINPLVMPGVDYKTGLANAKP